MIEEFVKNSKIKFGDGGKEFIEKLGRELKKLNYSPKNVHVISNMMEFNKDNICNSISEPVKVTLFHRLCDRHNILLLGDSLGDIHIDVGVKQKNVSLKIGFLNYEVYKLLSKYMEEYDIVIVDDQSMEVPNHILSLITK
uniref:5'-nucleotidase n=1 Tax=Strongyloides papillosus TaxID=174720 RepID=A0A0N5B9Y4_STREA